MLCDTGVAPECVALHHEAGGWTFLVISDYPVPTGYTPNCVQLLMKLPPGFPDAAPDMFWVRPAVRTTSGWPSALDVQRAAARQGMAALFMASRAGSLETRRQQFA